MHRLYLSTVTISTEINTPNAVTVDRRQASALKLWVVLARAYWAIEAAASADVARHGITIAEFGILEALHHKGPLLLGEIQRKLLCSSGGITYLVDRLEGQGLVERRECPSDRRARYAALTRKGQKLIRRIFPEHAERIAQLLAGLNGKDQQRAGALLRKLGRTAAAIVDEN